MNIERLVAIVFLLARGSTARAATSPIADDGRADIRWKVSKADV